MSPINKCVTSHIKLSVISHSHNGNDVTIYMSLISESSGSDVTIDVMLLLTMGVISHINI